MRRYRVPWRRSLSCQTWPTWTLVSSLIAGPTFCSRSGISGLRDRRRGREDLRVVGLPLQPAIRRCTEATGLAVEHVRQRQRFGVIVRHEQRPVVPGAVPVTPAPVLPLDQVAAVRATVDVERPLVQRATPVAGARRPVPVGA